MESRADQEVAISTITDVARVAGVSVATVSRALRGLDRVSPETRERVLRVAEDLHYVASPTATSLASGRTRVVAVVAPFLTRWFFATLVSAIEKTLRAQGHHVILFDLEDDSFDQRLPLTQNMLWKRVDGVITLNVPVDADDPDRRRLVACFTAVGPLAVDALRESLAARLPRWMLPAASVFTTQ